MARTYTAGLYAVQVGLLNANGYAAGILGAAMTNGNSSGIYRVEGRKDATITENEGTTVAIEEGDETVGQWQFGGSAIESVAITLSDNDTALSNLIGGTNESAASSHYKFNVIEENNANRPALFAILTQLAQGADGTDGTYYFEHTLIPKAIGRIGYGNMPYQDKTERILTLTPSMSKTTPLGLSIATLNVGLNRGKLTAFKFRSNKMVHIHSFMGDGSGATFSPTYKPASSSTNSVTGSNLTTVAGTAVTPTSINTSTGLITLASAPAAAAMAVILYEHDEVLVA
jgi:hypothetical protein